jgi:hypothetical protein
LALFKNKNENVFCINTIKRVIIYISISFFFFLMIIISSSYFFFFSSSFNYPLKWKRKINKKEKEIKYKKPEKSERKKNKL